MSASDKTPSHEARMVAIEEWMMYSDRLLKNLHEVLCTVQGRLDEQDRAIARLAELVRRAAPGEEKQSLEDDRPPHY